MRHHIENRKVIIVGAGIGGLAAAYCGAPLSLEGSRKDPEEMELEEDF